MYFQTIVNLFRTADAALNGANKFFHGTRKEMSLKFGDAMSQTHLLPIRTRWTKDDVMIHTVTVACWEQDALSNSMTDTEALIQTSQVRLMTLIDYILDNNPTISRSDVEMTDERKTLMATVSGYAATFTIISKRPC